MRSLGRIAVMSVAVLATGCATTGGQGLTSSSSCRSLKQQINRIAAKGLPPRNKKDSDTYNRLLNDYLGSRCHEAKT